MNVIIADDNLKELIETGNNSHYRKLARNRKFITALIRCYEIMLSVDDIIGLKSYSYLHYERLVQNYSGKCSVRIMNSRLERLIFRELDDGISIELLELDETHYGNTN